MSRSDSKHDPMATLQPISLICSPSLHGEAATVSVAAEPHDGMCVHECPSWLRDRAGISARMLSRTRSTILRSVSGFGRGVCKVRRSQPYLHADRSTPIKMGHAHMPEMALQNGVQGERLSLMVTARGARMVNLDTAWLHIATWRQLAQL